MEPHGPLFVSKEMRACRLIHLSSTFQGFGGPQGLRVPLSPHNEYITSQVSFALRNLGTLWEHRLYVLRLLGCAGFTPTMVSQPRLCPEGFPHRRKTTRDVVSTRSHTVLGADGDDEGGPLVTIKTSIHFIWLF